MLGPLVVNLSSVLEQQLQPGAVVVVVDDVVVVVTSTVVVVVATGAVVVVVVATGAVVVVVVTGAVVVVVVATGAVVVVVATGTVVVVVLPAQGLGEQLPGPKFVPPWVAQSVSLSRTQSNPPVADDGTQHWIVVGGAVVVVVATGALVVVVATGAVVVVVAAAQGLGEQLPGPKFVPPWAAQSVSLSRTQSKAPVAEDGTQHWIVVGGVVVVVVAEGAVVVVVLTGGGHVPSAAQASQQLGTEPTHAEPPRGAVHLPSRLIRHFVWPSASVRQQLTKPGWPQVDCSAQASTTSSHASRSDPASTAASATSSTQAT
jgi:hypothetical protein